MKLDWWCCHNSLPDSSSSPLPAFLIAFTGRIITNVLTEFWSLILHTEKRPVMFSNEFQIENNPLKVKSATISGIILDSHSKSSHVTT